MKKVSITGSGTAFTLGEAPVSGGICWVNHNYMLKRVTSGPAAGEFSRTGTAITLGTAFVSGDSLFAFVQTSLSTGLEKVTPSGNKNGSNLTFTLPSAVPANSHAIPVLNGNLLEEVASAPAGAQFTISGTTLTLAYAPRPADDFYVLLETAGTITEATITGTQDGVNQLFTSSYVAAVGSRPVGVMVQGGTIIEEDAIAPSEASQRFTFLQRGALLLTHVPPSSTQGVALFVYDESADPAAPQHHLWQEEAEALSFTATATSQAADAPASRIADSVNPTRSYRSLGLDDVDIVYDFGEQVVIRNILLDHTNITRCWWAYSQDNSSYTDLLETVIAEDTNDHYRKVFLSSQIGDFTEFAARYVRQRILLQETSDDLPYYKVGMVLFFSTMNELARNVVAPVRIEKAQQMDRVESGGRIEKVRGGPKAVSLDLVQLIENTRVATGINAIAALDEDVRFLLFLNLGKKEHAYWLQRDTSFSAELHALNKEERFRVRQVR